MFIADERVGSFWSRIILMLTFITPTPQQQLTTGMQVQQLVAILDYLIS